MHTTKTQRARKLILLVDDSATQAAHAAGVLEAAGFRVRLASNGRQALEEARRWRPDLIVSDVLMPVMDGFALCREVRRDSALAHVPIMLYTITFVDPQDEEFALALGATRYLVKPSDPAELVEEVRAVLAAPHTAGVREITVDETAFIQGYSARMATKLEHQVAALEESNRRLEQQIRETAATRDRLALLLETSQVATSSLDSQVLLRKLVERIVSVLPVTFGRISLLDRGGERLVIQAAWPIRALDWDSGLGESIPLREAPLHRAVIASGEPQIVRLDAEVAMDAAEWSAAKLGPARAVLLLPLFVGGQVAGLVWLGEARDWQRSPLTTEQIELAQAMAAQVMLAVENARLSQTQVEAEREARILADIGALFASPTDDEELLRRLAAKAAGLFAGGCVLHLVEPDGSSAAPVVHHEDEATRARIATSLTAQPPAGENSVWTAILHPLDPLLVPHMLDYPDLPLAEEHRQLLDAMGISSLLAVPLSGSGGTVGTLIWFDRRPGHLTADHLPFAEKFAGRAARAISERRLWNELTEGRAAVAERNTLRATLEASQDAVLIVDAEMHPRVSNRRFDEWFGVTAEELRRLLPSEHAARALARVERPEEVRDWIREQVLGPTSSALRRLKFVAGPVAEVECYSTPVQNADGSSIGRVFAFHDLTRESELARTKDEIVSVVSHELRTPLAAVVGFAELLLMREYPEEERQEFLSIMLQEGKRLTALINDFLDLQRIESGRQEVIPRPTELRPLLERAVTSAGQDTLRPILLEVPEDLPAVMADPDRIQQVLANLLSNARKYSPQGGEVRLSTYRARDAVQVLVNDHGLGIPPEALPRLFANFYRVDSSDRREIGGTGLGLAISRKIVEAHGGRIWAESPGLNQGTTVSFELPLAVPSTPSAGSGEVLVVEDNGSFARLLEAELASRGYSALHAESAEAALGHLVRARPSAVVLDLLLPGIQGEELLLRLRQLTGPALPVIVVTVKELDDTARSALADLRVVSVLQKGPGVAGAAAEEVARVIEAQRIAAGGVE